MVSRRQAAKRPSKAAVAEPPLRAKIRITVSADTPVYYQNHVEIAHSRHEFALIVARLPAKATVEQIATVRERHELVVAAELQILIPPTLIPGLIRALEIQRGKYEAAHGKIQSEGEAHDVEQ